MLTNESALRKDKTTGKSEMQHRHFATIAAILRKLDFLSPFDQELVVDHFADELACTNPRFDRKRFLAACK